MSLTIALRTTVVLPCALALGGAGCSYEYDRFKVDGPDARAGRNGSPTMYGGTTSDKGLGGAYNGGASTSSTPTTQPPAAGATTSDFVGGAGNGTLGGMNFGGNSVTSGGTATQSKTGVRTSGGTTGGTSSATARTNAGCVTGSGSSATGGAATGGLGSVALGGSTSGGSESLGTGGTTRTTGSAGTTSRCLLPLVDCGGVCVDLTNDPDHCGSCGHACFQASASWAVCEQRLCSCDGGSTKCNAGVACEKRDVCVGSVK